MEIKEYPEIKKDGEIIAPKTSIHELVYNFTSQMHERGYTSIVYFIDEQKAQEQEESDEQFFLLNEDDELEENEITFSDDDYPIGLSWGPEFTQEHMCNFIINYLTATLSDKEKMLFVTDLQIKIINDMLSQDEEENEEDEEEDD